MNDDSFFLIDIDKVLRNKLPGKYNYVPKFIVSYLKKIIHQNEINAYMQSAKENIGVDFLKSTLDFFDVKIEVKGLENLPQDGLCTFVSNHPLGGLDGIALGYVLGSQYDGKIKYLVNDLLMNIHNLAPLCIPVNKTGSQARNFPAIVDAGFTSDNHLIMFPAGICSRRQKGVVKDLAWTKTFIVKSVRTQRDVVPMHFDGCNSDFFYNLSAFRKAVGIKANLEMLFLADEMFKNKHKTFTLIIGKPISYQTFDNSKSPSVWASYVKEIVYKLNTQKEATTK